MDIKEFSLFQYVLEVHIKNDNTSKCTQHFTCFRYFSHAFSTFQLGYILLLNYCTPCNNKRQLVQIFKDLNVVLSF